ncbi:hypothetical protein JXA48_02985 [Candidatus Woesearchaeota archaeon]|nr:hypothetical protein [Candidatus Woesearchaeota archaeon]
MKPPSLSKHELHEELKAEAIAEFLGEEEEFHRIIHEETSHSYKQFLIFFVTAVILGLFASFAIFSPVNAVIEGQLRSSTLNHNIVMFGDYSLYFSRSVADTLPSLYNQNQISNGVESAYCLIGESTGNKAYEITGILYPKIYSQTRTQVNFAPCPPETVVMLHTHPYKSCLASDVDLQTLKQSQVNNKDLLMIVMCESMRFTVYS